MEAVPRLYMISFPLKTSQQSPDFTTKINHYIQNTYDQDPINYSDDLSMLLALRETSTGPTINVEGCSILKRYFCQLHALKSRFPMTENGSATLEFSWNHVFNPSICFNMSDITLEIASVLYNIGALHCSLGSAQNRTSDDEALKMACTHFQCAAWAFQELNENYPLKFRPDLSSDLLQYMYQLSLAQAQECILEKSMIDNRKALIIAKVSAKISEYYNAAMNALVNFATVESSIGETVGMKRYKMWSKYCMFKKTYYECVTSLFQGQHAEDQQQMGFRVSYYQIAFNKLEEAINQSKNFDDPEQVQEALTFTMDVVAAKWKASKTENELIYHEKVPLPEEENQQLEKLKGASLVKSIGFSVVDPEISGPLLFADLIPTLYQKASSMYREEKNRLLKNTNELIEKANDELSIFSSSLQLDCLDKSIWKVQTPQSLVNSCAAFQANPEKLSNLSDIMSKLSSINQDIKKMLSEINNCLKTEEIEDQIYQDSVGQPYNSIVITELKREANKYEEAHNKAEESNETLHKALDMHINNLNLMNISLVELEKHLPPMCTPDTLDESDKKKFNQLQTIVNKLCEMQTQRTMLASRLHKAIEEDDLSLVQVTQSQNDLSTLFNQQISVKYANLINLIKQNISAQPAIIEAVRLAYMDAAFVRKLFVSSAEKRREKITSLIDSFNCVEDLIEKSSKGLEFYNKLSINVSKLLQRVKGTCQVQTEERDQIIMNSSINMDSKPKIQNTQTSDTTNYYQPDTINNEKDTSVSLDSYYNGVRRPSPLGSEQAITGYNHPKEFLYNNISTQLNNLNLNNESFNIGNQGVQNSQPNNFCQPSNNNLLQQGILPKMTGSIHMVNTTPNSSLSVSNHSNYSPIVQNQPASYSYPYQISMGFQHQQNNLPQVIYSKNPLDCYSNNMTLPKITQTQSSGVNYLTNTLCYNSNIPILSKSSLNQSLAINCPTNIPAYQPNTSITAGSTNLRYGNSYSIQSGHLLQNNINNTNNLSQLSSSNVSNLHCFNYKYNSNSNTSLYNQTNSTPISIQGNQTIVNTSSTAPSDMSLQQQLPVYCIAPKEINMANYNQLSNNSSIQSHQNQYASGITGSNYYQNPSNTNVTNTYYSVPPNSYYQNYTTNNLTEFGSMPNGQNFSTNNIQNSSSTTSLLDDTDSHMIHAPPPLILPQKVSSITKTQNN
ncbi:tyrosine-protein phosphatase non-receptor type 23 [Daktulosphaira vitifoliae]|uniref:tyrosine-protein phosphatase non-receptor type 23 n=1 Tax=Daktulosphaira vitifoliae TaxID=58002 RepID=UPI0021AA0745|nr:tyrosine-protein phosphatase non-receptor type 23 [Daktulosphaira vitifoliae]